MNDRMIPSERPIAKPNPMLQDHLPKGYKASVAEQQRDIEENADRLLADMPALTPAHELRVDKKADLYALLFESGVLSTSGEVEVDFDNKPEQAIKFLRVVAGIDKWAESIAVDPAAYAEWAKGKDFDTFMAVMSRYASAVGK